MQMITVKRTIKIPIAEATAADRMRAWRTHKDRDYSQQALAEILEMKRSWLTLIESGAQIPTLRQAVRIMKLTGIRPESWVE